MTDSLPPESDLNPTVGLQESLEHRLRDLVKVPRVLVCCDYDGTLAPIVADPDSAFPLPEAPDTLVRIGSCPGVSVAVVSGRAVKDLKRLSNFDQAIALVGSHGAEFDEGVFPGLGEQELALLEELQRIAREITAGVTGAAIEEKPVSVAVHVRRASRADAERVMSRVTDELLTKKQIFVTRGKEVVEISVLHADKGEAVAALKSQLRAGAVLFVGDDVTDERAFAKLGPSDVGIKVGSGDTLAGFRVGQPVDTLAVLTRFAELRGC